MIDAGEDIRAINRSQAAAFLTSDEFIGTVAKIHGITAQKLADHKYQGPAKDWLYNSVDGPWADASARFADATIGEVRVVASNAQINKVFSDTEVPHLLANENVTTIDGISRTDYVARQQTHGTQAAFEMMLDRARNRTSELQVAVNYAGTPLRGDTGTLLLDSRSYFIGTEVQGKAPSVASDTKPLGDLMEPPNQHVLAGRQHWQDWHAQVGQAVRAEEAAQSAAFTRLTMARSLGGVATAADAIRTGERVQTLLAQDNLLGATHEVRDFAVNNANAWAAAYAVGKLGAEMGGRRGAYGAIAGGIAGGITGYVLSDKALQGLDGREIANQSDSQGRQWNYNGREWVRPMQADLRDDGMDRPQSQAFSADFDTRRELDYRATNTSAETALRRLPAPRDPYSLPANDQDSPSSRPSNWERNPDTGQWTRQVHGPAMERGMTSIQTEAATPERTAVLDRQAADIIQANIQNGPAAIAARYDVAYRLNGWETVSGVQRSPAIASALDADSLRASDGHQYRLVDDGTWRRGDDAANDRIAAELSVTRTALQPQLEQHARTMASLPAWQRPTQDQEELVSLATTYAGYGVAPNAESLDAIQQAVKTTRAERGLDATTTSLTLDPNAQGGHDINSPIMHMRTEADGVVRVAAVTTAEDIERARGQIRQHGATPDAGIPTLAAVSVRPPGVADGRESQVVAEDRTEARNTPLLADNPAHSDFDTFNRIHTWVRGTGQWDEEKSRNVASALYKEQATDPLIQRVDKVTGAVGRDGAENVFAVYAPFGDKGPFFHATVDGRDVSQQPARQNLEQAEQARHQQQLDQRLEQQMQQNQQGQRGAQISM